MAYGLRPISITADMVKSVLTYNPETGVFRWRRTRAGNPFAGRKAGAKSVYGYTVITMFGRRLRASRIAWLYMTGEWPHQIVDHVNLVKNDDRWSNLREATETENHFNVSARSSNKLGLKGVVKIGKKYRANIGCHGKRTHLGYFSTPELAHAAYEAAAQRIAGIFARSV